MEVDWESVKREVREAGQQALQWYQRVKVERKADRTHVTEADRAVERFLRERLQHLLPEAGFYGEETGTVGLDREWIWAVDPIDGTTNFVRGLPIWGVSVGLLHRWEPYAGWVYFPLLEEFYWGRVGEGAYGGSQRLQVADDKPFDRLDLWAIGAKIWRRYDLQLPGIPRSLGSAAAHLVYTARGVFRASIYGRVHLWDYAGGLAIAYAAGCEARWLDGRPFRLRTLADGEGNRTPVAVGPPRTLQVVLRHLHPRF
jgi:myo-inositol-1(or 4)-monophosphatase